MKRVFPIVLTSLFLATIAVPASLARSQDLKQEGARGGDSVAHKAIASADSTDKRAADSTEGQKHYESGVRLFESGKFDEALGAFKETARLQPEDPRAHFMLGMVQAKLKVYKDAVDSFKRATRLKPDWPEAHFQFGVFSYVLDRRSQAADAHTALLALKSPLADVLKRILGDEKNRDRDKGKERNRNRDAVGDKVSAGTELQFPPVAQPQVAASEKATAGAPLVKTSAVTPVGSVPANLVESTNPLPTPDSAPADSDARLAGIYRVGIGDVLDIRLLNSRTPRSTLYSVVEGGFIDLPVAGGAIAVAGLSADEIQTLVASELRRRAVEEDARVSVGIRQYASHSVNISGLVSNPGTKFLRREAVPLYVIMAESQARLDAGRVTVMRAGKEMTLDLADASTLNFLIKPGDLINVTSRPQQFYYIGGRVNYPGQKVFQSGMTLVQALLTAGGPARKGDNVIELSRADQNGRLVTNKFKLKELKAGKIADPHLQPGDRIDVVQ